MRKILVLLFVPLISFGQQTTGLFQYEWQAQDGYTLFAPLLAGQNQYLLNNCGEVVHSWSTPQISPANSMYLLEDGSMLFPARADSAQNSPIPVGGGGERIMHQDWNGNLLWDFIYYDNTVRLHHDIAQLPNGNVLAIAFVLEDSLSSVQAGRKPWLISESALFSERIIEIEPTGSTTGNIVWQWDLWDHLVQDYDPSKDNYGVVADHPELLDINWYLEALGEDTGRADFVHLNSIDYNEDLDQIVLSSQVHSEIWIIDHSTTTQEAAGHTGGTYGKGGDFLYRYGNPQVYQRGTQADQKLWRQHDANWIPDGYEDEGGIMIYNNGLDRTPAFSEVDVISPPQLAPGVYTIDPGEPFGPEDKMWNYHAEDSLSFFSFFISGAMRLSNGNTMICEGQYGRLFEVTHEGDVVWEYVNPETNQGILSSTDAIPVGNFPANVVFRATRYPSDYPAFTGHDLNTGVQLEANPILSSCIVGVEDFELEDDFSVYPNPSNGLITLENLAGAQVNVYSMNGSWINAFTVQTEKEDLDLRDQSTGVYAFTVELNGKIMTRKLVIE